jgi:hypothetical protein
MTGKQFSFFLGQNDQGGFEEALRASGDIAFLKIWPRSPQPEELPTSHVLAMGEEILDLWIARREDIHKVEFRCVKGRDVFSCDPVIAPVIQFGRCFVTGRFIRAGRLHRVDKYWNPNNQLVRKPDAFIDWANRLYKLAQASLTKIEQGCYAGAEAMELRKAGVAFEGLDVGVGSIAR